MNQLNTFSDEKAAHFLQKLFTDLFNPQDELSIVVDEYMTEDYVQLVDGKTLNKSQFKQHLEALLDSVESISATLESVIASGNTIADIHIIDAIKKDGSAVKAKVIAFFYLRGSKVAKVDELTYIIEGNSEDKDMGSRY
ncbi:nuclear transport factor 2 family protein [Vibrio paucivorans]